ncbi:MAG: hypothetical protein ACPGXK_11735, partial [Phycisphaerae bacterium]
ELCIARSKRVLEEMVLHGPIHNLPFHRWALDQAAFVDGSYTTNFVGEDFDPTTPPESNWLNPDFSCLLYEMYTRLILPRVPTVRDYHAWLMRGFREEPTWRRHAQELGTLVEVCRRKNVPVRVVLLPFIVDPPAPFDGAEVRRKVGSLFEQAGVECVDLFPVIAEQNRSTLIVNRADPHPNEAAHALFADAIWRAFYQADGRPAVDPKSLP